MASNAKTRTLVKGVSSTILKNYDQFQSALHRMEKYHQISNDFQVSILITLSNTKKWIFNMSFQVMAFTKVAKEALDNVVDMFEDDDAKKQIRAQISVLKAQQCGGEASVFRGSSRPGSHRFYKYMFMAKVNHDGTVNFNLCSLEKQANLSVMKSLMQACQHAGDAFVSLISGAFLGELVKDGLMAWSRVFGFGKNKLQELTLVEFITEFDMTRRLIDGKYCELDENTKELFLIE